MLQTERLPQQRSVRRARVALTIRIDAGASDVCGLCYGYLDISGLGSNADDSDRQRQVFDGKMESASPVRKRPIDRSNPDIMKFEHESRLANLFTGPALARSAFRWEVFYRRDSQPGLLPLDLSCPYGQGEKLPVFFDGGRSSRSWLPPLFTLPP